MGNGRTTHDVDIAKLVQPEVIRYARRVHEVALLELLVDLLGRDVKLVEDPSLDETLLARWLPETSQFRALKQ